MNEADTVI